MEVAATVLEAPGGRQGAELEEPVVALEEAVAAQDLACRLEE